MGTRVMCDSDDDYFFDDLVLDDKTLAVLDKEESKFRRATSTQVQHANPPAKRQKTTGPWQSQSAGRTVCRADTLDDMEYLPDISIRQDGTYGLRDKQGRVSGSTVWSGNAAAQAGSGARTSIAPLSRGPPAPVRRTPVTAPTRSTQASSRPPPPTRGTRITQSPASSQDVSRTQPVSTQRTGRVISSTTDPSGYVEQLLQQIEELRKRNETIQAEMQSALEAKFAKEGEVTILRKRLEKIAQEHSAQITKLKSAKEESDAKHVLLQKQYEADKERLKTELTFKRHELESSAWRQTVSHSPKIDVSQTTGPLPSQKQKSVQWDSAGPSRLALETPRRPRFGVVSGPEKPRKTPAGHTRDLPSGFQTGSPRSQSMTMGKEKETAPFNAPPSSPAHSNASPVPQGSSSQFLQPDMFGTQFDDGGLMEPTTNFIPRTDAGADDVQMVDEGTPVMTLSSQENIATLALPSWSLVLHNILLSHTLQGSNLPTLQLLVCACPADTSQVHSYGAALMQIFDALGSVSTHPDNDFDRLARIICCALCKITQLIAKNDLIAPLTAVLNLLTNLAYLLPSIRTILLSCCASHLDETSQLLQVLHHIIQNRLQTLDATAGYEPTELCSLGRETLALHEALVWWIPDEFEDSIKASLSACPGMPSLFTTLLHPNRPLWFLIGGIRVLLWLSTRRSLFHSLLTHVAIRGESNTGEIADIDHHPQIDVACALLIDTSHQGREADELKSYIIMFFGMISNAHPDAYTLLVESRELIPSIVLYLCHKVALIWDEAGVVLNDPQAITRTVHVINHATSLLHRLVIGGNATLDLRQRLLHAPTKSYRGLVHSFILTFGRLSYANPPYWLDREQLVGIADLARALLERVIQGPELDLMWETYQDEGDENESAMDVDDEEVEAQKIARV